MKLTPPDVVRLGVLGGTFDPPHLGHWQLAEAARAQLRLDKILWGLTAAPPHKQHLTLSPLADRLAMVLAAIGDSPHHELSRIDIDRPGPHWAADTVALLAAQFPRARLFYLMGGDSLRDLPTWGRPLEFLAHCELGVARRPGDAVDLPALEMVLPGLTAKVNFIEAPPLDMASRELRRRAQAGETLAGWVAPPVEALIRARQIYRPARVSDNQ